jgi:hypothetical protein
MSAWRNIVVDGVTYTWIFGIRMVCVRYHGRVVARYDTAELLGLSNDEHERAIRKRTLNGSVTPRIVERAIRATVMTLSAAPVRGGPPGRATGGT